jgi:hypothetical protein
MRAVLKDSRPPRRSPESTEEYECIESVWRMSFPDGVQVTARSGLLPAIKRLAVLSLPVLLGVLNAQASVYNFTYTGVDNPAVSGSGTFTTGTAYANGYVPITSITGTAEGYAITGLEVSGGAATDPGNNLSCCAVGPGGDYYNYDNAFMPGGSDPFSSTGGLLFDVAAPGDTSPINLFGDGNGNTYEFSYGEDTISAPPSYGGTQIIFTATLDESASTPGLSGGEAPEPSFYGALTLGLGGLLLASRRGRRATQKA